MKTKETIEAARKRESRKDQQCYICRRPYRGENTVPVNQGYGVYKSFPAHVRCERDWS